MVLNKGKHIIKEIEGVRCTVVEQEVAKERVKFLKELLEHNGFEVKVEKEEKIPSPATTGDEEEKTEQQLEEQAQASPTTYIIGVTDLVFNPVIAVYERALRTKDKHKVTPDYWNQKTDKAEPNYWDLSKKYILN